MVWSVIGFIILQYFLIISVYAQNNDFEGAQNSDCQTPNDLDGNCIVIHQCSVLFAMLTSRPLPRKSVDFLKRSQCGFDPKNPKVCCPLVDDNTSGNGRSTSNGKGNGSDTVNVNNNTLPDECGFDISRRILGGEDTEIDEFPWMVLLEYRTPTGITTGCAGFLISHRYVMTAAHCIKGLRSTWTLTSVRLGEYDTSTDRDCIEDVKKNRKCADDPVTIEIVEQIVHEQFKPTYRDIRFDIALLRLSREVEFTNYIKPVCLPSSPSIPEILYVVGWGITETGRRSNVKLKLSLSIIDVNKCAQRYKRDRVELGYGQICAGGQQGKDSCEGDSGGPLMSLVKTSTGNIRWTALGIVSFGSSPCGIQGSPGIYTKVYDFVPWAIDKIRP